MKLISSISFIVISIVLFFVVADPLYGDVKQLRSDVSTYNEALDNSTDLQKNRDVLIEDYKGVKISDRERLAHFLPSSIGNIELILEIEKIANIHGMPIGDIKFDTSRLENKGEGLDADNIVVAEPDPEDYLPYGIFPMEFIIEGRYDTFVSFLEDLEHNLRLVDVKSIAFDVPAPIINSNNTIVDTDIYSYTLKVETYWLK